MEKQLLEIQLCTTGINYIWKYITIEKLFSIVIIYFTILLFFDQINAVLVSTGASCHKAKFY